MDFSTARYIIKRYEETGSTENKPQSGRSKLLTKKEQRHIIKEVSRKPFTSVQSLAENIAIVSVKTVSAQTIRNVLHSAQIYERFLRMKLFINEVNRQKRLDFAKVNLRTF